MSLADILCLLELAEVDNPIVIKLPTLVYPLMGVVKQARFMDSNILWSVVVK